MLVETKLEQLGITLPAAGAPAAAYVMTAQTGSQLYLSGHIARRDGKPWVGQLGRDMTTEQGKQAARAIAIDLIATLKAEVSDLDRVVRIVKLVVLVNSTPDFTEQHLVANGCSELMRDVFESAGLHARSAYGVAQLPMGSCVEIELVAEVQV
jgi:enamine deaminase RidA (YjgF/YER057c/UK114 family)